MEELFCSALFCFVPCHSLLYRFVLNTGENLSDQLLSVLFFPLSLQGVDATVIQTSLREMEEELGIPAEKAEVSTD